MIEAGGRGAGSGLSGFSEELGKADVRHPTPLRSLTTNAICVSFLARSGHRSLRRQTNPFGKRESPANDIHAGVSSWRAMNSWKQVFARAAQRLPLTSLYRDLRLYSFRYWKSLPRPGPELRVLCRRGRGNGCLAGRRTATSEGITVRGPGYICEWPETLDKKSCSAENSK